LNLILRSFKIINKKQSRKSLTRDKESQVSANFFIKRSWQNRTEVNKIVSKIFETANLIFKLIKVAKLIYKIALAIKE